MKNIFFLVLIFLSLQTKAKEEYIVTVVHGQVLKKDTRKQVQPGDKISDGETVIFKSNSDFLILLNAKGRYMVSTNKQDNSLELTSLVIKEHIHFHGENMRLSSRAIGNEMSLAGYFKPTTVNGKEINDKILVVDELRISIRNMGYRSVDNQENFFFLQLIDANKNGTSKKLFVRNDSLVISKQDFIFNGKMYEADDGVLKLGFVEGYSKDKKVTDITVIKPVFMLEKDLSQLVHAVKLSLYGTSKDEILNEIYTELYFLYGKPDMNLIEELYNKEP